MSVKTPEGTCSAPNVDQREMKEFSLVCWALWNEGFPASGKVKEAAFGSE